MKQIRIIAGIIICIASLAAQTDYFAAHACPYEECVAGFDETNIDTSFFPVRSDGKILIKKKNRSYIKDYSSEEIAILERIVEAEATGEDIYGKILVANVVLNRVLSDDFPDTIKRVVFKKGQFQPIQDGRYYDVEITDSTREAVKRVIEKGEDYSGGALYFRSDDVEKWRDFRELFTYGGHTFYK